MIEQYVLDRIRATFELYGFAPLETRAVEPLDQLLRKGETSKEVYVLRRLQEDPAAAGADDSLGLHFDLTVPFARFVLENAGKLQFPFRRYQIQKVWRGERPQEGRYREFLQADIDVVDRDTLPFHYDAEMPLVIGDALRGAADPAGRRSRSTTARCARASTAGSGWPTPTRCCGPSTSSTRSARTKVAALLVETAGATDAQAKACLALAAISAADALVRRRGPGARGRPTRCSTRASSELVRVVEAAAEHAPGLVRRRPEDRPRPRLLHRHGLRDPAARVRAVRLDLLRRPVRQPGHRRQRARSRASASRSACPGCSGCCSARTRWASPGRCRPAWWWRCRPRSRAPACDRIAAALRRRGIATEVAPAAAKFGKQIRFAERRGIPYVWFPGADGAPDTVKDIRSGDQVEADAATWEPPADDLHPVITQG